MKIIFLDIDGVLVTRRHLNFLLHSNLPQRDESNMNLFDPICVEQFERIIDETHADIVVSSTWRMLPDKLDMVWYKRKMPGRIIGVTPRSDSGLRGKEISRWLEREILPIDRFVILDDEVSDMGILLPYCVQTTWMHGLTEEKADEVIRRLNN